MTSILLTTAALQGMFDGARVLIERAIATATIGSSADWDWGAGRITLFEGNVAAVEPSSTQVVLHVKSELEKLNVQMPRTLFQPACVNSFGDENCGIVLSDLAEAGHITGTDARDVQTDIVSTAHFGLGYMSCQTGANSGYVRPISTSDDMGLMSLVISLPNVPVAGDNITCTPGCDRSLTTCLDVYNNTDHFRGCPFIPVPESTR